MTFGSSRSADVAEVPEYIFMSSVNMRVVPQNPHREEGLGTGCCVLGFTYLVRCLSNPDLIELGVVSGFRYVFCEFRW